MINKLARWQTGELSTIRAFPKHCAKYDNQTQPSSSPYLSVCRGPTRRPATWFHQIRRPSFSTTHATEGSNRVLVHIICVKDHIVGSEITLVLACLQENAKVSIKKKRWPNFLFEIRLTQYVFRKILRNTLRKRTLSVSQRPASIIKMFWNFKSRSWFYFMVKFNRQVMSSLLQNRQKFLLMNMR